MIAPAALPEVPHAELLGQDSAAIRVTPALSKVLYTLPMERSLDPIVQPPRVQG